jgi:hypothetical protein
MGPLCGLAVLGLDLLNCLLGWLLGKNLLGLGRNRLGLGFLEYGRGWGVEGSMRGSGGRKGKRGGMVNKRCIRDRAGGAAIWETSST